MDFTKSNSRKIGKERKGQTSPGWGKKGARRSPPTKKKGRGCGVSDPFQKKERNTINMLWERRSEKEKGKRRTAQQGGRGKLALGVREITIGKESRERKKGGIQPTREFSNGLKVFWQGKGGIEKETQGDQEEN